MSFAFSSFGATHQQPSPGGGGGGSPRLRPTSPLHAPSPASFSFSKPRLSPEQLLEVAKQATNPRYLPSTPSVPGSAPHSPVIRARPGSPQLPASQSHLQPVTQATFTPLPPDVYLPFLDRPVEVAALLSAPPSSKLFALLAQTFSKNTKPRDSDALPHDTADWTFADLAHWLTQTTRDEAADTFWVQTARRCILLHSELIWERLKGALGVPPELDVEYTESEYDDVFETDSESDGSMVQVDAGKFANGMGSKATWEERKNATLDSPVFDSRSPAVPSTATATMNSTPTILTQVPTPREDETYFTFSPLGPDMSPNGVIIEPILALVSPSMDAPPPPLSLPASLSTAADAAGLGYIGEEDEEEEGKDTPVEPEAEPEPEAMQLHGLRISTPGAPTSPSVSILRSAGTGAPLRSPSFSARESASSPSGSFPRSRSAGSLHRSGSFGASSVRSIASEGPYDPVADRAPGNPLFPSNFARLALGPTLAANNPTLRSPPLPPQSKYTFGPGGVRRPSSTRSIERGNRFRRSWGGGDEYAVTLASESSTGGSVKDA